MLKTTCRSTTDESCEVFFREPGEYIISVGVGSLNGDFTIAPVSLTFKINDKSGDLKANILNPFDRIELNYEGAIKFEGAATGGIPPYTYFWNFEGAPNSAEESPGYVLFNTSGDHEITFTVTDKRGYSNTEKIILNYDTGVKADYIWEETVYQGLGLITVTRDLAFNSCESLSLNDKNVDVFCGGQKKLSGVNYYFKYDYSTYNCTDNEPLIVQVIAVSPTGLQIPLVHTKDLGFTTGDKVVTSPHFKVNPKQFKIGTGISTIGTWCSRIRAYYGDHPQHYRENYVECYQGDLVEENRAIKTVGRDGGEVEIVKGNTLINGIKLEIPAGALSAETKIAIQVTDLKPNLPDDSLSRRGDTIELLPHGLQFKKPVKLTIPYPDTIDESKEVVLIGHYNQDTNKWKVPTLIEVDPDENTVTVLLNDFSIIDKFFVSGLGNENIVTFPQFDINKDSFIINNDEINTILPTDHNCDQACFGFACYSQWYFNSIRKNDGCPLRYAYTNDYSLAELLCEAQEVQFQKFDLFTITNGIDVLFTNQLGFIDRWTHFYLFSALKWSKNPQFLYLEKSGDSEAHSALVVGWNYDESKYLIYDPNNNDNLKYLEFLSSQNKFMDYRILRVRSSRHNFQADAKRID